MLPPLKPHEESRLVEAKNTLAENPARVVVWIGQERFLVRSVQMDGRAVVIHINAEKER